MRVPSAACIPRLPDGRVLVGTRTGAARSFAGFAAFPGGTCDDDDDELQLFTADALADTQTNAAREDFDEGVVERIERACALRELGEETGRWLVVDASGAAPVGKERDLFLQAIAAGESLVKVLRDRKLFVDDRRLIALGRWPTPRCFPKAFTVRQYLLPMEHDAEVCSPHNDELENVDFVHPETLLEGWHRADVLLLPPIYFVVRALCDADDDEMLLRLLNVSHEEETPPPRMLVAGVAVEPLRSPTLPPATHTNCVLLGEDAFIIVDPATPYDDEQRRFDALLDRLAAQGRHALAIVLTHHHIDHVADAERLAHTRGLPIWAHRLTADLLHFEVSRILDDNEVITLNGNAAGDRNSQVGWQVIFTPGHAPGHICLFDVDRKILVAGDMVASLGSILIDPPEGHMGTYLASLQRLIDLDPRRVVPAHGPMLAFGRQRLQAQLDHRRRRSESILLALKENGTSSPLELVARVYGDDTPEKMWPLAARSLLAELEHLFEEGLATRDDDKYAAIA